MGGILWPKYPDGTDQKGNAKYRYEQRLNVYDFKTADSISCMYNIKWKTGENPLIIASYEISNSCGQIAYQYSGSDLHPIDIYDYNTMTLISSVPYAEDIRFSSNNRYLVTASAVNQSLSVWEVSSGKLIRNLTGGTPETIDVSGNMQFIATSVGYKVYVVQFPVTGVHEQVNSLELLYPNPANGLVNISFNLPISSSVTTIITDVSGKSLEISSSGFLDAGENKLQLDLSKYPAGTYFITINSSNFSKRFKVILNK
jgi:WD40 repeat protein